MTAEKKCVYFSNPPTLSSKEKKNRFNFPNKENLTDQKCFPNNFRNDFGIGSESRHLQWICCCCYFYFCSGYPWCVSRVLFTHLEIIFLFRPPLCQFSTNFNKQFRNIFFHSITNFYVIFLLLLLFDIYSTPFGTELRKVNWTCTFAFKILAFFFL